MTKENLQEEGRARAGRFLGSESTTFVRSNAEVSGRADLPKRSTGPDPVAGPPDGFEWRILIASVKTVWVWSLRSLSPVDFGHGPDIGGWSVLLRWGPK